MAHRDRFVQGGERYEELSLLTPGSVTLKSAHIYYEPFLGTANTFKGYFVSSDESLNKLWYDGAYTLNLMQMRPNTPAGYWITQDGALNAQGGDAGILNGALDVTSPAPAGYNQLIGPFMGSYDLWARFQSGDTADAFQLLETEWGQMLTGDSQSTMWEYMNSDGSVGGGTSMAHGWSTGPTSALSEYVLGIAPTTPGYRSWLIEPHPGTIAWTEGQAPTPYGPLVVKWEQDTNNKKFVMQVQAPRGTGGTIAIPTFGHQAVILVNNHLVWNNNGQFHPLHGITGASADDQYITLKGVAAGNYLIVSKQTGSLS